MSISHSLVRALCLGLVVLFLLGILPAAINGQSGLPVDRMPEPLREWTFMVYMDADNNLESAGIEDLNEMEEAYRYSTNQVNVVVQFDRTEEYDTSNGDWKDCKRFVVENDYDTAKISSEVVQEMGESNMGDPNTLVDFVKWSFQYYPAKKYALVLWDHGGAYRGVCWDDTNLTDGVADCITLPELRQALAEIKQARGYRNLDLLGFDACSMAQIGVLYEIQDYVDVCCASGFVEPGDGWPYERILPKLLSEPTMDKHKLGEVIADEFQASYSDRQEDPDDSPRTTMTAFNMTMFPRFAQIYNEFSVALSKVAGDHYYSILHARDRALSYDMVPIGPFTFTNYCLTDVKDFCMKLIDPDGLQDGLFVAEHPEIRELAQMVIDSQDSTIIISRAYPPLESTVTAKKANGLTVYFPNDIDTHWDDRYSPLMFPHDMFWDNFLQSYWFLKKNAGNTPPACLITYPEYVNETVNQDDMFVPVTGTAFDDELVHNVKIQIDGGEWMDVDIVQGDGVDWYYDLNVDELAPGTHTIKAQAFDEKGSESPVAETSIYIAEGANREPPKEGFSFNFNYLVGAVIISLIVLGVAILIRDRKQGKKSQ